MLPRIKIIFIYLFSPLTFLLGFILFQFTGKTSGISYQALIRLFCMTKGYSSDVVATIISFFTPKIALENTTGILGDMSGNILKTTLSELKDKGYIVFESALSDDMIAQLRHFSETTPALTRRMDTQSENQYQKSENLFEIQNPLSVRYDYKTQDLLNCETVQNLMADNSILSIAQAYLGCRPIVDIVTMWWHTNFSKTPDKEAAQYFHFDMDRVRWIKFFVYLTDVGPDNGPHTFVSTSHRSGQIPMALLRKGYSRLTDEEVKNHYSEDKLIEFRAPKGTIIIEDTRGLHKGKHVSGDPRLLFQLQFTQNLFGTTLPEGKINSVKDPHFKEQLNKNPNIYSAFKK